MSDLKTALLTALQKTPVPALQPKGQMEQVWLWIRDHPESTIRRLKVDLKHLPPDNISSLVAQLCHRKMVDYKLVLVRPVPKFGKAEVKAYTVTMKTYELLPSPVVKKAKAKAKEKNAAPTPPAQALQKALKSLESVTLAAVRPPVPEPTPEQQGIDVQKLPVSEALRLYRDLRAIFGELQ